MLYAAQTTARAQLEAPGICHYDTSARVQTVDGNDDAFLHGVLSRVGQATGCPILINTSLNPRGAPILSKVDATRAFAASMRGLGIRVFNAGSFAPV
jgi:carbamoyltransferase